jgi:hypothetical protein
LSKVSQQAHKNFSIIDNWIIDRLKKESSVPLTILSEEYARERNIKPQSARKVLERHLKLLIEQGIVERLNTYPVSYRLKKLPLPSTFRLNDPFDLSYTTHNRETFELNAVPKQKIEELRKVGLRVITRANKLRQRALLTAQYKASIRPGTREHADIAYLYEENIKEWNHSVLVFENDNEEFMITNVKTRFNDKGKALWNYLKSRKALEIAFKKYKNAIMVTLTLPRVFPLVVPLELKGKIIGFIPLQDSIITQLKANMLAWIRKMWKGEDIKVFTAYEYHGDYALHLHVLVFGIPYLIPWNRKFGRKKEDALTYYAQKYNIPLPSNAKKTLITKYVFTALLDKWLQKILVHFGSALKINLLQAYLEYKRKEKIQGPINEIHRIKDGKWKGKPPKDAVLEYSSGACYRKVLSPDRYVTKYVLKIYNMLKGGGGGGGGGGIGEEDQAKVYGYWLFGKRFNSYSPSLLPKKDREVKIPVWHFVGVFNILNIPDYVRDSLILDLT